MTITKVFAVATLIAALVPHCAGKERLGVKLAPRQVPLCGKSRRTSISAARRPLIRGGPANEIAIQCDDGIEPSGFENLLVDSKLTGWIGEPDNQLRGKEPNWKVENGILTCAGGGYGFLRYNQILKDFVLLLEFRNTVGGNSGIGIRAKKYEGTLESRPSMTGYEVQIIDDHGGLPTVSSTGSLYRYVAPRTVASKKAGEWNSMEILCHGSRIKVRINGHLVQNLDQAALLATENKSLFGYIMLQCHATPIQFRNIRLKTWRAKSQESGNEIEPIHSRSNFASAGVLS